MYVADKKKCGKPYFVRKTILEAIRKGAYPVGQPIPSENKLVGSLGISRNSIREAVASLVHEGILQRKRGSGTYVLLNPRSGNVNEKYPHIAPIRVGLVIAGGPPIIPSKFLSCFVKGLTAKATDEPDMDVRFLTAEPEYLGMGNLYWLDAISNRTIDILIITVFELSREHMDFAMASNIPMIYFGLMSPNPNIPGFTYDLASSAAKLIEFLSSQQYQKIGLLLGRKHGRNAAAFLSGMISAYSRLGKEPDLTMVAYTQNDKSMVPSAAMQLLEHNADAIVCYDDDTAVEVIRFLNEKSLKVPDDIAVTGVNDTAPTGSIDFPALTTLRVPLEDMGKTARPFVYQTLRAGQTIAHKMVFDLELIVRDSAPERMKDQILVKAL